MIELTPAQIEYLASQRLGRIATAGADNKPHVVPTSFRYNPELGTVDIGGHHVATTKKYRDVQANPAAAIVVDDLESIDPWTPRMLEIRGRAEAVPPRSRGLPESPRKQAHPVTFADLEKSLTPLTVSPGLLTYIQHRGWGRSPSLPPSDAVLCCRVS